MNSHEKAQHPETRSDSNGLEAAILEASAEGIAGADPEGVVNFWNPAAGRIFGYAPQEILGQPLSVLIPQDQEWEALLSRVKCGDTLPGLETEGKRKDGRTVSVALNISPVKSTTGETVGMSIAIQDITDRKRAEGELREREQRFFKITSATNDATYDWDVTRDRLTWDAGITTLFGYKPEEIESTVLWRHEHLHPEDQERVMRGLQEALDKGSERWMDKYKFRCATGDYSVVIDRGFIVRDESGRACRMLGGMTDVTESERAQARQAALLELGDRLREEKEVDQVAKVAAEIAGRTLHAARAGYARVNPSNGQVEVPDDWTNGELPTCAGERRLNDCFKGSLESIKRGEMVVSENTAGIPPAPGNITEAPGQAVCAFIHVPLLEGNQLADFLYIHDTKPRRWTAEEVTFAKSVADRTWASIQRVCSERRLKESELQLRTIADLVPDLLWRHDPEGQSNWHNRQWTEYTGQSEEDSSGLGWLAVTHPDEREQILNGFRHAMETGTAIRNEIRLRRQDGQFRWFLVRAEPRRDSRGQIIQWFGAATDMHEQRMALEALTAEEERYRMLIELAPHTIWMSEWDGAIIYCSAWWYDYTGLSKEETLGMGWTNAIHPDHREKLKQEWLAAVRGVGEWNVEVLLRRAEDGAYHWHLARGLPIRDEQGRITRWIGIAVDVHDRKEATQALQREKALLEGLAESLRDGILIVSDEGKLLYFNQRFLEIWHMPTEIMASSSDEVALRWAVNQVEVPEDFRARVLAVYQDTTRPVQAELRMKDGRVYDHFGAPVRKGDVHYGWVWTFRDITEQKRAEADLRASESKHQFLNQFNEGIRELNDAGEIMAAAARLLGQHLGSSCCAYADIESETEHFHVEGAFAEGCAGIAGKYRLSLLGSAATGLMQAGQTLVIYDAEVELEPKEGVEMFGALGARALICCPLVKEGRLRAMMMVHQAAARQWKSNEVHLVEAVVERCWSTIERARAERALRESEQRFRQLADAMPQLVWTLTPEGKPEYVNRRWRDYTGIEDVHNQRWLDAVHPEDRDKTLGAWMDAQREGSDICLEHRVLGKDGYQWFQARVVAIKDPSGRVLKWCGSATDFDDVVRARETLARNQAELERFVSERTAKLQETIAQLEAFSYSISHDMRGPLRAMQGFSYLLLQRFKDKLDPEGIDYLQIIERSAKRLDLLIQDVLSYSRIAREAVRLEPVQVSRLVRDIVNQYPGLQAPQAEVKIQEPMPLVLAQPSYLTQVLSNLISNAVKFVPSERQPKIEIRAERRNGSVRILIEDNGIGIDPKDQARIFNIFERVYSQEEFEGTGIGLSIVRKAMDRMGGRVGVDSTTGEGSCFWIELQEART
ncbi:MAG: hypothetical protein JWM16_2142 [Verrucomicrobiales bacterium]|nr:hypothetical protein [Verrucomicrobiales bacterium]